MDEIKQKSFLDKLIDKSVDFIFSKDPRKWLFFIMVFAIIIRFIVVSNVVPLADEMVHGIHAINFIEKDSVC